MVSSSVMTTRRHSATGSTSLPLTGTFIGARVSTSKLQALEANTELNNTYSPHPIDNQPSVNGRRRTRFTLHRLLCAAIPTVFAASKFIDSVHGRVLTLDLLDLIPAILVLMLYVSSWFESDPPQYLGRPLAWLFDTDWDYLLDMTKRGVLLTKDLARRAKNNPFTSLGIIVGAISVLLAITSVILLSPNHYPGGYIDFFRIDCSTLGLIALPAILMVVGGDQHQRNAYKHAFSMSAISTQLAMLASWTMRVWFPDRPRISFTLFCSGFCLWCITCGLGLFTGHSRKLMQAKFVFASLSYMSVCRSVVSCGTLQSLLNNRGDPNFRRDLAINIGLCLIDILALVLLCFSLVVRLRRY